MLGQARSDLCTPSTFNKFNYFDSRLIADSILVQKKNTMADQQEPTTPAELAKDVASLTIDADNKAELTAAAAATTAQDEAVIDPVTRMQEWRDEILANQGWKDLQGPALNEWAAKQAEVITSITRSMLKTRQPRQLKDLTVKWPEKELDPELEARKNLRMAELKEIWKREDSLMPERDENQEEFKWDTNSIEYKKIMDARREFLRKSDTERSEDQRRFLEVKEKEDLESNEAAGNSPVDDGHQC
ncbi:uncharacterized protein LOC106657028 [Trichogramma pretiosum]|uniref:uncharacterized protein LOC106657028 n=1 Tax=Trichogramma pretiosum TaxID=7493 RepID=UPI0006C97DCB|nr:uncharacterized protein LOC106657028 [Trichogramma pretiosum]